MMHLYTDNQRQYILLGAKQLYFNRFAANCNPMNLPKEAQPKKFHMLATLY